MMNNNFGGNKFGGPNDFTKRMQDRMRQDSQQRMENQQGFHGLESKQTQKNMQNLQKMQQEQQERMRQEAWAAEQEKKRQPLGQRPTSSTFGKNAVPSPLEASPFSAKPKTNYSAPLTPPPPTWTPPVRKEGFLKRLLKGIFGG
ncbi:MAG: hypothetical protein U0670_06935 [Anaerolineae bacterium]